MLVRHYVPLFLFLQVDATRERVPYGIELFDGSSFFLVPNRFQIEDRWLYSVGDFYGQ